MKGYSAGATLISILRLICGYASFVIKLADADPATDSQVAKPYSQYISGIIDALTVRIISADVLNKEIIGATGTDKQVNGFRDYARNGCTGVE